MVSVIVPNYNHGKFLKQRIESVLQQSYSDFELIILDDASTDNSCEVLNEYIGHAKVKWSEVNKVNSSSPFAQWKKGLLHARGEWVWVAESDDFCEPTFLELLLSEEIRDDVGLRFCNSNETDVNGIISLSNDTPVFPGTYKGHVFLERFLLTGNCLPNASAVLVKYEILKEALTEDILDYNLIGDWLVWIKCALKTNVYYIDKNLNYHRTHNETQRKRHLLRGEYYMEFPKFRKLVAAELKKIGLTKLFSLNRQYYFRDEGLRAIELARNGDYVKCMLPLYRATTSPNIKFHFLRGCIYWMIKNRFKKRN